MLIDICLVFKIKYEVSKKLNLFDSNAIRTYKHLVRKLTLKFSQTGYLQMLFSPQMVFTFTNRVAILRSI